MTIASITGIGWVASQSMGCGRRYERPAAENGKLPKITSRMIFGKNSIHFGRLDNYSKLGVAAIAFALKDAHLDEWFEKRPIGMIASTVYGCLAADMDYYETVVAEGGAFASPNLFVYTLSNVFLGEAAVRFGLTGTSFVITESVLSGMAGLRMALSGIASGECPAMLVGICDAGRPETFPYYADVTPGALFFLLEKTPKDHTLSYGGLGMDNNGEILFQGIEVQSQQTLFRQCIKI